ncbi:MAG TPA: glycosidase, partial [Bacteroidales bacterium]|nr:glycosidase [Bacteroidales bacterium]
MSVKPFIRRRKTRIIRDTGRVITRAHIPTNLSRINKIACRVLALSEDHAADLLKEVLASFSDRHRNIEQSLAENFKKISDYLDKDIEVSYTKQILIGAYFTMEYSIESAALFNPSIVEHPDQSGLDPGELRFIMSLRATGEGHISSIVFRSGVIESDATVVFDTTTDFVQTPKILHDPFYLKNLFELKLIDMEVWDETSRRIVDRLPDIFTFDDLT